MVVESHLEYSPLDEKYSKLLDSYFGDEDAFVQVGPKKVILPKTYELIADQILNFKVREDDVWLISLPRTGSTWTQEMVWMIGKDFDYETAHIIQHIRAPLLELSAILYKDYSKLIKDGGNSVDFVEKLEPVRFIKTHLPIELLPKELFKVKPKIVYVARNPKDMCVSYYYYFRLVHDIKCTFEEFCELFLQDKTPVSPIWDHLLGFWKLRNEPNIMFVKYEDMKKDVVGHIHKMAEFLGKTINEEQVSKLVQHISFENMKKNPATNIEPILEQVHGKDCMEKKGISFIRKGKIGDHKNHMSEELSERFDNWIRENLKGTGLSFES